MATAPRTPRARATAPTASEQAGYHKRARSDRATETSEDYVEAIADLIDADREARVTDIARRLGVSHVTVIRTIGRLQRGGLVTSRPYRSIFLTVEGRRLAERVRNRHRIVLDFLRALGIDDATARADAEGIEHHVSRATLGAFERFLRNR